MVVALALAATSSELRGSFVDTGSAVGGRDVDPPCGPGGTCASVQRQTEQRSLGPIGVTVIGTSLTARYTWPDRVASDLRAAADRDVVLTRFAQGGVTSDWGLRTTESPRWTSEVAHADVVLIEFLANDSDMRNLITVAHSRRNHEALIRRIRATAASGGRRPVIILLSMSPTSGIRGLLRLRTSAFTAMYREVAQGNGVGFLDLTQRWLRAPPRVRHFSDGLHPSDTQANAVIPRPIVDVLRPEL